MTDQSDRRPLVSVIMANYNGGPYLAEAIRAVQAQTLSDLEIILADDASADDSIAIAENLARGDRRLRMLRSQVNRGPAAARNQALTVARGDWIAVVDSDDLIHPRRLETLVAHAERDGADIVADDLILFDDDAREPARPLFRGGWARAPHWIDAATYIRSNVIFGHLPALGYCKPVLRRSALGEARYDERLIIGEDSDLIARLLVGGARMRIYPDLTYFYRRHSASVSHRITEAQCVAIEEAEERFRALIPPGNDQVHLASRLRAASARRTLYYERLVAALKARSPGAAIRTLSASPSSALLLGGIVRRRLASLVPRRRRPAAIEPGRPLLVLSRQRLEGATNGSSAYLLSIVAYLKQQGFTPHFRSPSSTTFGRTPFIRLGAAAEAFASFEVRGGTRIGNVIITTDPRVLLRMVLGALDLVLFKLRVTRRLLSARAPYAVAAPLTRADRLFVAAQGAGLSDHVLFDYAYLTETRPYLLGREGRTLVLMHDLVSTRQQRFARIGQDDSISHLAFDEEAGRLSVADAVIAIQAQEAADLVAGGLTRPVIVAPMAAVVREPHPGRGDSILFVGSSAAPNRDGLQWFCDEILPLVRQRCPTAVLQVAGSVTRDLQGPPPGVSFLGVVPDLAPLYREAAVVISPLRVGSGLKIKLVEALSWGKAIVATSTTIEGVEREVAGCVRVHDDAAGFAEAVVTLLADDAARTRLATAAHGAARAAFSSEACYGPIVRALAPDDASPPQAVRLAAL
ncbi:glycosyltransferase [Methylobacterium currus]|uniref:glycosyltransferase n=1 Tax=Methylobacterium currus TaxID=2051553 RepID=UPI0013DFE34E|nr:glycosyltransferase [Methylobacterium currus]UHC16678.1 glycosyltransferase [Methylobacterium currus]